MKKVCIKAVRPGTIAYRKGLAAGDRLLKINGRSVIDVLDILFLLEEERLTLEVEKADGSHQSLSFWRELDEDLGLDFEDGLLDDAKSCSNNCLFCFIDQLPKGMRPSLYFKDDDSRLSFLQGNFITLTNLGNAVFQRLIDYRISPINISVHTTDPELRVRMLKNKRAGLIMTQMEALAEAGISMNAQIVLVPDVNDGEALDRTLKDLIKLYPQLFSVAIVPIGLTRYREGLESVRAVDKPYAAGLIKKIHRFQKQCLDTLGTRFVFLADEFYIQAEKPFPLYSHYESYIQLENGVGLVQRLRQEVGQTLRKKRQGPWKPDAATLATGVLAAPFMRELCDRVSQVYPGVSVEVIGIENRFFGEKITVSGLLTGQDIIEQLKGRLKTEWLLLPESLLKADEPILLDDITVSQIEEALHCKVRIVRNSGGDFVEALINRRTP